MKEEYLIHHGIKGQKWGIRRYQNEDGSLTPAGRERYGADENGKMSFRGKIRFNSDRENDYQARKNAQALAVRYIKNNTSRKKTGFLSWENEFKGKEKLHSDWEKHKDKQNKSKVYRWALGENKETERYADELFKKIDKYSKKNPNIYKEIANSGMVYVNKELGIKYVVPTKHKQYYIHEWNIKHPDNEY